MVDAVAGVEPVVIQTLGERLGDRAEKVDQDWLRKAADIGAPRLDRYKTAVEYYEGDQHTLLTDRAKAYLDRSGLGYCENYCQTVVDALAERLSIVGVTTSVAQTDEEEEEEDELGEWLWDSFDANRGDELQTVAHGETTKYGDGFIIVDFNPAKGTPRYTWNNPTLVKVVYEDGTPAYAVKVWNATTKSPTNPRGREIRRMNVYWPNRVEKWFTVGNEQGSNWVEWLDDGDTVWPTPWVDTEGEPLGIPVFHFANDKRSDMYGRPEHLGTIPQQDRLNKELIDLSAVLDHQGFPQRYATGVSDTSGLTADPGTVWSSDNPAASYGQFSAADPSGSLAAIESTLIRIATRSRTPAHLIYLSTGIPSGESLKTAESGLVAKTKKRQVFYGGVWAETFRMAGLVALTYGAEPERPPVDLETMRTCSINVRWQDAETRNEKEHLDALTVMSALGVSKKTILSMIPGVDPDEEMERKEEEKPEIPDIGEDTTPGGGPGFRSINPPETWPQ